jgi:C-terminal processing protease CtpA/Prc
MQIEKRGKIVGDVTAGMVEESVLFNLPVFRGSAAYSVFGIQVTIADLVMSDGQRLEGNGVIPDIAIGPSDIAYAAKTDPVLAYAASLSGAALSPEDAGKYYFMHPVPEPGEESDTFPPDSR